MRRSSLHHPATLVAAAAVLLAASGAIASDRPRSRPTPVPQDPPTSASADPATSPVPFASALPLPSASLPAGAGCYGLDRPAPFGSVAPTDSGAPVVTATPGPTPTPRPDSGETNRYKVKAAGVRLDLPADWLGFMEDDLAALEDVPELTDAIASLQASSLDLLGVDVLPGEGCVVGGNLSLYDLGAAVDPRILALTVDAIAAGLENLPEVEGDVKVSTADLPIGEVQRLTFRFDATADGAVTAWWVRADVFLASGHTLLAAYAAPESSADAMKPAFNAIAKSLREL